MQTICDLVYNQWWTKWNGPTDAEGKCQLRAFYGKHRVTVNGKEQIVVLKSADGAANVEF